jgi:hypothetical protein
VTGFTSHHGMGVKQCDLTRALLQRRSWLQPCRWVVVGNRIKCSGFCPGVGKVKESRCSTWAHASRSFSEWADEPRAGRSTVEVSCCTGWGAVEAPCRTGLVRVEAGARSRRPVERASYESETERGRGALSSGPRTRRTGYAVEAGCLLLWFQSF